MKPIQLNKFMFLSLSIGFFILNHAKSSENNQENHPEARINISKIVQEKIKEIDPFREDLNTLIENFDEMTIESREGFYKELLVSLTDRQSFYKQALFSIQRFKTEPEPQINEDLKEDINLLESIIDAILSKNKQLRGSLKTNCSLHHTEEQKKIFLTHFKNDFTEYDKSAKECGVIIGDYINRHPGKFSIIPFEKKENPFSKNFIEELNEFFKEATVDFSDEGPLKLVSAFIDQGGLKNMTPQSFHDIYRYFYDTQHRKLAGDEFLKQKTKFMTAYFSDTKVQLPSFTLKLGQRSLTLAGERAILGTIKQESILYEIYMDSMKPMDPSQILWEPTRIEFEQVNESNYDDQWTYIVKTMAGNFLTIIQESD